MTNQHTPDIVLENLRNACENGNEAELRSWSSDRLTADLMDMASDCEDLPVEDVQAVVDRWLRGDIT